MDKYNFLQAKDAIFRLLADYCLPIEENGQYYMSHCFIGTLQKAFLELDIREPKIPLMDFCQLWEDNNRAIFGYWNASVYPYVGATAQMYYDTIIENYLAHMDIFEED